jgi:hypothetical protein
MFIQVLQGKVRDEAGVRRCLDRWERDLMPGARGYLGTTAGFSDGDRFVALARFQDERAARDNSNRPEQGEWWDELTSYFDGDVSVLDCTHVEQWMQGGSDQAGFVQIMEGHSPDVRRMNELMQQHSERIHQQRPEIIGALMADDGGQNYVEAVYFTSEAEAREHEKMDMPEDMRAMFEEEMSLMGEVTYLDLHQPMLVSAR